MQKQSDGGREEEDEAEENKKQMAGLNHNAETCTYGKHQGFIVVVQTKLRQHMA